MTWQPVPWFVGVEGEVHPAEVQRLLAYAATGGSQGIVGSKDCEVRASAVPDGNVNVYAGAVVGQNRNVGGGSQAYIGRNPSLDVVPIAATTAAGPRTDLIYAEFIDPTYAGNEAVPAGGPYVRTSVIQGVPTTTRRLRDVAPNKTGVALALVTLPASTGTVTQAMITDLRRMAQTLSSEVVVQTTGLAGSMKAAANYTWQAFGGSWTVDIPDWATSAIVTGWLEGAYVEGASGAFGEYRVNLLNAGVTASTIFDENNESAIGGNNLRVGHNVGGRVAIPAAVRGTSQTIRLEAEIYMPSARSLQLDGSSTSLLRIRFEATPETNV